MILAELIGGGAGALFILLSFIQVAPVKINPWSAIFGAIGKAMTQGVSEQIKEFEKNTEDRFDIVDKKFDAFDERLISVEHVQGESQAISNRVRILRFADEIYMNVEHSKEHFDQVLDDITRYTRYCKEHPEFENDKTGAAIKIIRRTYERCLEKHSFLV